MTDSDERVIAYVDGELDAAARRDFERALAFDADLAERVQAQRRLRGALADAFAVELDEPLPARLRAALDAPARPSGRVRDLAAARRTLRAPANWPRWGALAASLLLGLLAGRALDPFAPTPAIAEHDGALRAQGALAVALQQQPSGAAPDGPVRLQLSFRDQRGQYCRSFALPASALAGLACQQGEHWRVELVTATAAPAAGAYRQASSELPAAVLQAIDARIAGEPLDAAAERAVLARGWRP